MKTVLYCVECLNEIHEDKDDGLCNRCRKHLANGGEPREHGGETFFEDDPQKESTPHPEIWLG